MGFVVIKLQIGTRVALIKSRDLIVRKFITFMQKILQQQCEIFEKYII